MKTLYVGFDVFYPGAFNPAAAGPSGHFYIVLQPMIFFQNNPGVQIGIQEYFSYTAKDIFETFTIEVLTPDNSAQFMNSKDVCPVPFPPETTLFFKNISWTGQAGISIPASGAPRTIGWFSADFSKLDSPFLLEKANWAHFASVNNMSPRISDWSGLDTQPLQGSMGALYSRIANGLPDPTSQRGIVLGWLAGAAGDVARRNTSLSPDPPLSDVEKKVFAILQSAGIANSLTLSTTDLLTKLYAIAGQLYDCFLHSTPVDNRYQPKQFVYSEQQLTTDSSPVLKLYQPAPVGGVNYPILPLPGQLIALSYHERLWNQVQQKLDMASSDANVQPGVVGALGRLFGFGERLFWPRADEESFIRYGTPDAKGWICTSAQSLLGHTFGFQLPLDRKLSDFSVTLHIQGYNVSAGPLVNSNWSGIQQTGMLEGAQNALVDWYAGAPPGKVSAALSLDPDPRLAGGFFVFQPKMSACTKDAATTSDALASFAVPSALLDAVDPVPRWAQPKGTAAGQMSVATPPRTGLFRSDVYRGRTLLPDPGQNPPAPSYTAALRLRVSLMRVPVPYVLPAAYELTLYAAPLPVEQPAIQAMFKNLVDYSPTLLISGNQVKSWKITAANLLPPPLSDPQKLRLVLADDANNDLANLLKPAAQQQGSASPDPGHASCDLVLSFKPEQISEDTLFNLLATTSDPDDANTPFVALQNVFNSWLNRSTERFQERVGITLSPWPTNLKDPTNYVPKHLRNFNLLRMSLASDDARVICLTQTDPNEGVTKNTGTARYTITLKDALIPQAPLPPGGVLVAPWKNSWTPVPGLPQYGYFLSQIFTQDMRDTGGIEALRYVNYLTPQVEWSLDGDVAHQYGPYLSVTDAGAVTLPLTTNISHPGSSPRRPLDNPNQPHSALMTWRMPKPRTTVLQLSFSTAFLNLIIDSDPPGLQGNRRPSSQSAARYRAVYEPLADFLLCLDNTDVTAGRQVAGLTLRFEGWAFDGTDAANKRLSQESLSTEPPPTLIGNMRMLGAAEIVVTSALLGTQRGNAVQLQQLRGLLNQSFGEFVRSVCTYAAGTAADWTTLDIPLAGWTTDSSGLDPSSLYATADIVRVGLTLIRPGNAVAPVPVPRMLPGFAMQPGDNTKTKSPNLPGSFSDLEAAAATELERFLTDSQSLLRQRFEWLRPDDGGIASMPARQQSNGLSPAALVGDVAPYVSWHPDPRAPIDRVLTLYYVPIAFVPLSAHYWVGDPGAVEDFVGFLLELVSDIVNGLTPAVTISDATDVASAYGLRSKVIDLYRTNADGKSRVVDALVNLVQLVEPDYGMAPSYTVFSAIRAKAVNLRDQGDDGWSRALAVMLDQKPKLFADAQGFAVALVDHKPGSDSWNDSLMALQVAKTVPTPAYTSSGSVANNRVVDRIAFTRVHGRETTPYFIDTFDTARYHDEFQIARNSYTPQTPPAGQPAAFSAGLSLKGRGDIQARIADNFLRNSERFDESGVAQRRTLEAEAVPYNPVWNAGSSPLIGRYLLPARLFPEQPVVMIPSALDTSPDAIPPWRTEMNLTFPAAGSPPDILYSYWKTIANDVFTPTIVFPGTSAQGTLVARNSQFQWPLQATGPSLDIMPDGWWYLDTYATHYHFRVKPDKQDSWDLDAFRIEIEMSSAPFKLEQPAQSAKLPDPHGLLEWYRYLRMLAQNHGAVGQDKPPRSLDARDLIEQLTQWLSAGGGPDTGGVGLLMPLPTSAPTQKYNTFQYTPNLGGQKPRLDHLTSTGHLAIGDLIGVDLLQLDPADSGSWVLRVIVLDQAWVYTRVRVTQLRNENQIHGKAEFSSDFAMESQPSAWSSFGREPLTVDMTSIRFSKRNLPDNVVRLKPGLTASDFIRAAGPTSYGAALSTARDAQFAGQFGNASPRDVRQCRIWNPDKIADPNCTVRGTVLQQRLDLHPRYRLVGADTQSSTANQTRMEMIPRQFLPDQNTIVAANAIDQLGRIDRTLVNGLHQSISVVWLNQQNEEVLTVIWPVAFGS